MMGELDAIFCKVSWTPSGDKSEGRELNPGGLCTESAGPELRLSLSPNASLAALKALGVADERSTGLGAGLLQI